MCCESPAASVRCGWYRNCVTWRCAGDPMTEQSGGLPPLRVEVTTKFLAEASERQRAYEARRRMWTATFHPSEPRTQVASGWRRVGRLHDPREGGVEPWWGDGGRYDFYGDEITPRQFVDGASYRPWNCSAA